MRFAAGIQNKVLEAMAAGLPVVTTSYVNNGLQAEAGRHLLIADEPEQFVAAVIALLNDRAYRRRLGHAGREFVLSHYRWEEVAERMNGIEQKIARRG